MLQRWLVVIVGLPLLLAAFLLCPAWATVIVVCGISAAAAYELLGKRTEARELLGQALQTAALDGFLVPFVENYRYLDGLLEASGGEQETAFVRRIRQLGEEYLLRQRRLDERAARPAVFAVLTEREYEIVRLMAGRISNREIAEKLFLSEGSVKQYVNQIYSKLHVEGDTRTKRKRLVELASKT